MKKIIFLLFLFGLCSLSFAKPITIDFDKELREAKSITYVQVLSYTKNRMHVKHIATGKKMKFDSKEKKGAEDMRSNMQAKYPSPDQMQWYWPKVGECVLLLCDASNRIKLMAIREGDNYKFWDPIMRISGSAFYFSPPAKPTNFCNNLYPNANRCFDGCLYPVGLIEER